MINEDLVQRLESLARLPLTNKERAGMVSDLKSITEAFDDLKQAPEAQPKESDGMLLRQDKPRKRKTPPLDTKDGLVRGPRAL